LFYALNVHRRQLNDWKNYKRLKAIKTIAKPGAVKNNDKNSKLILQNSDISKNAETAFLQGNETLSIDQAKDIIGVSERKFSQLQTIDSYAPEEVKEALNEDKISVNAAYEKKRPH